MAKKVGRGWMIFGVVVIVLVAIGVLLSFLGQPGAVTGDGTEAGGELAPAVPGCAFDGTTTAFSSVDKFDNSIAIGGNHFFKVNGGVRKTVANLGTDELSAGDQLEVMWNEGNATAYNSIETYTVPCAATYDVEYKSTLRNSTGLTIQCFNEEGDVITGTTNETIGTGDAPTLECQIRGTSKAGLPHGGILVIEINSSDYKENEIDVTGFVSGKVSVPDADSVSSTDDKAVAFAFPATEGAVVETFFISLPAEDAVNPGNFNDPVLRLYDADGYEEEDETGAPFLIGVEDQDSTAQGLLQGEGIASYTLNVD